MIKPKRTVGVFVATILLTVSASSYAEGHKHPFYIHARSDLRAAQILAADGSTDPDVASRLKETEAAIGHAINEIDKAAVIDHKDLNDHPPVDTSLDKNSRFRRILELLNAARGEIGHEEDDPSAKVWQTVAYQHIDRAIVLLKRAANDMKIARELGW